MQINNHIKLFSIVGLACLLFFTNSCKKKEEKPVELEKGTVIDVDGNSYTTLKIGNKWWMIENLKVTKYNDGSSITLVEPNASPSNIDTTWSNKKIGAYCVFGNYQKNISIYGLLYNWHAINHGNLAPIGWHIPSDLEWKELEHFLGMAANDLEKTGWRGTEEGSQLKVEGPTGWSYPNYNSTFSIWGNNKSGFAALAGSCCLFDGNFGNPGLFYTGFWWSASASSTNEAWYRHLDYKNANVFRYYGAKTNGYSVRCVKD